MEKKEKKKSLNILILNWRDIKNPQSGGAEVLTHEIASRLVKAGNKVTIFSPYFKGAKKKEMIKGVRVIRDGNPDLRSLFSSVHFKAFQLYRKNFFGKIDVVVDEIHGVPFFTPFYVKEKKVVLICEIAGDLWNTAVTFPFNYFGRMLERVYPNFYNKTKIVTISNSTKKEISNYFNPKNIDIIHPGCSTKISGPRLIKDISPRLIFIARLSKPKGIEEALSAIEILKQEYPNIMLDVVGRGTSQYVKNLKQIIHARKISKNVTLHGFVSEKKKIDLIDRSSILLVSSKKEGWGLTVHEANSRGVPVVGYKVPGLREVIKNNINGLLCKKNTPEELAGLVSLLLKNKNLYVKISKGAIKERKKFTWEKTTEEFLRLIK